MIAEVLDVLCREFLEKGINLEVVSASHYLAQLADNATYSALIKDSASALFGSLTPNLRVLITWYCVSPPEGLFRKLESSSYQALGACFNPYKAFLRSALACVEYQLDDVEYRAVDEHVSRCITMRVGQSGTCISGMSCFEAGSEIDICVSFVLGDHGVSCSELCALCLYGTVLLELEVCVIHLEKSLELPVFHPVIVEKSPSVLE
ncbi:hypothetical protein Tco_1283322 [Tanacetum coccineum]